MTSTNNKMNKIKKNWLKSECYNLKYNLVNPIFFFSAVKMQKYVFMRLYKQYNWMRWYKREWDIQTGKLLNSRTQVYSLPSKLDR